MLDELAKGMVRPGMTHLASPTPPVYPRFLAGDADTLRLSVPAVILLTAVVGVEALLDIWQPTWAAAGPSGPVSLGAAGLAGLLTAALAARWLGARLGLLSGLVYLAFCHTLPIGSAAAGDWLVGLCFTTAMAGFGVGCVPGRLPPRGPGWPATVFYLGSVGSVLGAGLTAPVALAAACGGFVVASQYIRGFRFFADPVGVPPMVLAMGIRVSSGTWLAGGAGAAFATTSPPTGGLATGFGLVLGTGIVIGALVSGIRQGHYATPFWRYVGFWTMAAMAVGVWGNCGRTAVLPPLAMAGSVGLARAAVWYRRGPLSGQGHFVREAKRRILPIHGSALPALRAYPPWSKELV